MMVTVWASSSSTQEGSQLSRFTHPQSRWIEILFEAGAKNIGHAGVLAAECQALGDGVACILHKG